MYDLGFSLPEGALLDFVRHLPPDSETWRAMHRTRADESVWSGDELVQTLLATICDKLDWLAYLYAASRSRNPRSVPVPEPMPRPGVKSNARHYGRGAIPVRDFEKWWAGEN